MNERSRELHALAQRFVDALPHDAAEEVVLTGSVSRGVADEVSDVEMLIVTPEQLELDECSDLAQAAGLEGLDTWGDQSGPTRRVSGYFEGVPFELIWWSREQAESSIDSFFSGDAPPAAEAIANGVALQTSGSLARWQARLADYPEELARARIESAALPWGGFTPAGLLTLVRPDELLARAEWMLDGAVRVLRIVYALNRIWPPTTKRLAARAASLPVRPARIAERIEEAFTEPDPHRALLVMTELELDAVALAPDGPSVNRARVWLAEGARLLAAGAADEEADAVLELLDRFCSAVAARDAEQALSMFVGDADVTLVTSGDAVARGPEELNAFFRRYAEGPATYSWRWDRRRISRARDLVWLLAEGVETAAAAGAEEQTPYRMTMVCERREGRWLIAQLHGSSP